jgi:carboxypeptidase C (cathepsin A)
MAYQPVKVVKFSLRFLKNSMLNNEPTMPTHPVRLCLLFAVLSGAACAQTQNPAPTPPAATKPGEPGHETKPSEKKPDEKKHAEENTPANTPIPAETTIVTQHTGTFAGRTVHYTATAGNLLIHSSNSNEQNDKPDGSLFYVAYTEDGADPNTRPITFLYNGGPGAASLWIHMGSVGPVRVVTAAPDPAGNPPYKLVPNDQSLLDQSDLVFIDAPLAGFSRAVGKGTVKDFAGTDPDIHAFDRFILRYVSVNRRWNSPKYLFGESYGTTRSAGLVAALQSDGLQCNGVILLSTILNYGIRSAGYDTQYIGYLPSFAAIAWYHDKVKHTGTLKDWVQSARDFASGPYAQALYAGNKLSPADFDATATRLAAFTGLSVQYVKEANLRVSAARFRKELLRTDDRTLGRFDARFEGWDSDAAGETPDSDPSDTGINSAYVTLFHDYLARELNVTTPETYFTYGPGVNPGWEFKHKSPDGEQRIADTAVDLADAIRKDPKLKIFSANGEFDVAHMQLPPQLVGNVEFHYYPAGHMVYVNPEALKQFRADLTTFYNTTSK